MAKFLQHQHPNLPYQEIIKTKKKKMDSPRPLLALLQKAAIPIHRTIPPASNPLPPPPQIRHLLPIPQRPPTHLPLPVSPPLKPRKTTRPTPEVLLPFLNRHPPRQRPPRTNHDRSMRAQHRGLHALRIQPLHDPIQRVRHPVVQRRDALPIDAGTDAALVALVQDVREVRV